MTENVELIWYPWTIHGYQYILVYPLVRVSVDAIVTVVSLDHPWLPVYTGLPPCQSIRGCHSYCGIPGPSMVTSVYWSTPLSEYPWMPELLWYPWTIHGYQYILVYPLVRVSVDARVTLVSLDHPWLPVYTGLPPCQSICGCYSYSGIPGPSMVTSVYWSTPLVRVYVDARVTLVSQDHPQLPVYTGLPPCQSIHGCHSYSGIPEPSMVTSIYWSTPLSEYPWML